MLHIRAYIFCVVLSIAVTAPIEDNSQADKIISYENNSDGKGNYDFR